jgi:hypothetical protein
MGFDGHDSTTGFAEIAETRPAVVVICGGGVPTKPVQIAIRWTRGDPQLCRLLRVKVLRGVPLLRSRRGARRAGWLIGLLAPVPTTPNPSSAEEGSHFHDTQRRDNSLPGGTGGYCSFCRTLTKASFASVYSGASFKACSKW